MLAMSNLEMIVVQFLGIAMLAVGAAGMVIGSFLRHRRDGVDRRWIQFSLRSFLLWAVPIAVPGWILSWEGPFFTKQATLSPKAGAVTLLALALYGLFFVRFVKEDVETTAFALSRVDRRAPRGQLDRYDFRPPLIQ